jgi:hypothetical protein
VVAAARANDAQKAGKGVRAARAENVSFDSLLQALVPVAASTLQLKYPTPHGMIALAYTWDALDGMDDLGQQQMVESCARYLAQCPKTTLRPGEAPSRGEPYFQNPSEGLKRSLREHRSLDALFYAERFLEADKQDDLGQLLLAIAAHEVDPLGHVFIYTTTALRLIEKARPADRSAILLAAMEYLARKAQVDEPALLDDERPVADILPRAFERPNILGHNVIYAAEIDRSAGALPPRLQTHLVGQLHRNIQDSECTLTYDQYCNERNYEGCVGDDCVRCIEDAFQNGDVGAGYAALARGCIQEDMRPCLRQALLTLFARIDTPQPHYLIYPAATFELLDRVEREHRELALAQLVAMGVHAAQEQGLRPHSLSDTT